MALSEAETVCVNQGVAARVTGGEDQGVCANAPKNFGKQDDPDLKCRVGSVTGEFNSYLRAVSAVVSTETASQKQDSGPQILVRLRSARIRECAHVCLEEERQAVRIKECAQPQLYL